MEVEESRPIRKSLWNQHLWFGSRHPDLGVKCAKFGHERRPALRIQVRGHLVEQKQGANPGGLQDPRLSQKQGEQQRFLLAC